MSTLFWGSTTLSAEPFCVAAETFLPDHYDPEQPDVIAPRFRQTLRRVVDSSVLWGLSITALTAATTGAATLSLFTRQPEVLKQISMRPILVVSSLIAPMLTAEGVLVVLGESARPRPRKAGRGGAAATTRTLRGDESRRRRGCDADIPQRRVAATRILRCNEMRRRRGPPRGYSAETSDDAAAATWKFR